MRAGRQHGQIRGTGGPRGSARAPFFRKIIETVGSAKLKSKLVVAYAGTAALAILIIGGTSYLNSVRTYRDEMTSRSLEIMRQISRRLESDIGGIDALVNLLYMKRDQNYEPIVRRLTGPTPDVPASLLSSDREFSSYFADVVYLRKDCTGITIRGVNGWEFSRSLSGAEGSYTTDQAWFVRTMENPGSITVHGTHRQFYLATGRLVFSLSRQLVNPVTNEFIGVMMIEFDLSSIRDICGGVDLGEGGEIAVYDAGFDLIYHSDESRIMTKLQPEIARATASDGGGVTNAVVGGEPLLVISLPSRVAGWRLVSTIPTSTLTRRWRPIGLVSLMVGALMLTAMLGISLLISGSITGPIRRVNDLMRRVGGGDYSASIDGGRTDEIGQLNNGFNHMVMKIRELIQKEYVSKLMEREAELKALQAQINPHFIYNTLELISTISLVQKVPVVDAVAMALSHMLRYSIQTTEALVPLGHELRHVEDYLSICRIRFENSIRVRTAVDTHSLGHGILRLTIQPLVENAIIHGFHESHLDGTITISAGGDGDDLLVEVSDDGVGMDAGRLETVRRSLTQDTWHAVSEQDAGTSIGLKNVHARIALYYGPGYGLSVESRAGKGTRVIVRVPRRVVSAAPAAP